MHAAVHELLLFRSVAAHAAGHGERWEPSAGCLTVFVPKLWWRVGRNNAPSCVQKYPTSHYKYKSALFHWWLSFDYSLRHTKELYEPAAVWKNWRHPRPSHLTASAPKLSGKTSGPVGAAASAGAFATRNRGPAASALERWGDRQLSACEKLTGKGAIKARVQSKRKQEESSQH